MNIAIVSGRLGHDPELKYTQAGMAVANFSIASDSYYKGEKQTEWHNIVVWDKQAENVNQFLKKGSKCLVNGRLQTQSWEKDGVKHYKTQIVASFVEFLDGKPQEESAGSSNGAPPPGDEPPF